MTAGTWTYDWCKKDVGSLGYDSVAIHFTWRWHWVINGLTFVHTPEVFMQLDGYGNVSGTVYYDN